jgi:hypothetical protein
MHLGAKRKAMRAEHPWCSVLFQWWEIMGYSSIPYSIQQIILDVDNETGYQFIKWGYFYV